MKTLFSAVWIQWKELAHYVGNFQSRWLVTVFYFTIALPFGLVARFLLDPLNIRRPPEMSGWNKRTESQVIHLGSSKRLF